MKNLFLSAVLLFIFNSAVFPQAEGDRVIAVAGNEIITESDFQYQVQLFARQNQLKEISPYIAQQIFQSMLTNKILLAKAQQDSIEVTEDEVSRELDNRLKAIIQQVGSEQRMEEVYGMSMAKIKAAIREDLQKNLMVEKLKRSKFQGAIRVSDKEVNDFYRNFKDSLPEVTEEFELAHIFLERKVSDPEKAEAKRIAELILDSIKSGMDFSELAKRNSQDPGSAPLGGDLGVAKKGTFVKEFEETVFSLKDGEVSDVVETEFGYHIIKLNEKQGDKVKCQHILIKFPKFESSDFETINFLNDLKIRIENKELTFEDAAKKYSMDTDTKDKGGYIGKIPAEQIDSLTLAELKNLTPVEISKPLRSGSDAVYGYELFELIKVYPPHKLSLKDDYSKIKRFAESYKENLEMEKWINEIRKYIYVDVKM